MQEMLIKVIVRMNRRLLTSNQCNSMKKGRKWQIRIENQLRSWIVRQLVHILMRRRSKSILINTVKITAQVRMKLYIVKMTARIKKMLTRITLNKIQDKQENIVKILNRVKAIKGYKILNRNMIYFKIKLNKEKHLNNRSLINQMSNLVMICLNNIKGIDPNDNHSHKLSNKEDLKIRT